MPFRKPLAPVLPSKIIGIGKNYADHAAEMGGEAPTAPLMFFKPSTSVIGPGDPIRMPDTRVDYEGELAVVIGRLCREVPVERVPEVVLGYTCANDVTARDWQQQDGQWSRAKGLDSFCPLGPWIETDARPVGPAAAHDGRRRGPAGRAHQHAHPRRADPGLLRLDLLHADPRRRHPHRHPGRHRPARRRPARVGRDRGHRHAGEPGDHAMSADSSRASASPSATSPRRRSTRTMRTRFAPAPSGDLHVGNIRTALYSWSLARRHGGTFLLRVEDTDRSRVSDEAFEAALDVLRWMGIDYDEGPDVGGPYAPVPAERAARRLRRGGRPPARTSGAAYRCYCTPAELAERREQARRENRPPGYDGRCRTLTAEQKAAFEAEGRTSVLRFRMPDGSTTWNDLVRGEITIDHANVPDFALTRSDGHPLYLLAAGVDDVAMGLTHIVRGEDLVTATPRQLALYAALGHPQERWPAFAHLPLIVGDDNAPLSKRNGEVSIVWYRREGFLPEAMVNYLVAARLVARRRPGVLRRRRAARRVRPLPGQPQPGPLRPQEARGDQRRLDPQAGRGRPRPARDGAAGSGWRPGRRRPARPGDPARPDPDEPAHRGAGTAALPVRVRGRLRDRGGGGQQGARRGLASRPAGRARGPRAAGRAGRPRRSSRVVWGVGEKLGLNKRKTAAPVRVAVTGRLVSPPLFESMELLGRERTLARLRRAVD